jgi:hypothetical protein
MVGLPELLIILIIILFLLFGPSRLMQRLEARRPDFKPEFILVPFFLILWTALAYWAKLL